MKLRWLCYGAGTGTDSQVRARHPNALIVHDRYVLQYQGKRNAKDQWSDIPVVQVEPLKS